MSFQRTRITQGNLKQWPVFEQFINNGKVKFDSLGRLRYLHGAPVGDMVLTGINKDNVSVYKESAEEWFDPESSMALQFQWP